MSQDYRRNISNSTNDPEEDIDLDSSGENPDKDIDSRASGEVPSPDPDQAPSKDPGHDNNTTVLTKSQVPGSSENPVIVPSYDPVDNTDLSLENPDLPNNENLVTKEVENKTVTSKEEHPKTSNTGNSPIDDTGQEDQESGFSGNSDEDIFTKPENITKALNNHTMVGASSFDKVNKTAVSTKKLLDFLDISENYTKNSLSKSNTTNSTTKNILNTYKTKSLKETHISTPSLPVNPKTSSYLPNNRYSKQTRKFPNVLAMPNRLSVPKPYYNPRTSYVRPNIAPKARYYPGNSINNRVTNQNSLYPYQTKFVSAQTTSPYYRRWYSQNSQKWPYRSAYQVPARQLTNAYQVPKYQRQMSNPRQGSSWYNTNTGQYQRSNIPRPNTVLTSEGRSPFAVFEDALLQKRQKIYQNYPYYRNDNLPVNTVKTLKTNPFVKPGINSASFANGKNVKLYAGTSNSMVNLQNNTPQKLPSPTTKKQAFDVFQAAIYLADLLKNGKCLTKDDTRRDDTRQDDTRQDDTRRTRQDERTQDETG